MKGIMSSGIKRDNKRSEHSRHRRTKDCRTRSRKSGLLAMSAEVTKMRDVRSVSQILHYSHRRLIQNRFQVVPENEIQGIERRFLCYPLGCSFPPGGTTAYQLQSITKLPTWSPKMMPTWLYRQHFAMFPLNHHYNLRNGVACEYYNFKIK
ncbi:hypothetical protein TNCV_3730021 [Trichonephila clavipes]|nr:hypothetical protein TNCV_3730021 [Trichonephila clavipes]